jgi:hypothetical protein
MQVYIDPGILARFGQECLFTERRGDYQRTGSGLCDIGIISERVVAALWPMIE